MSTQTTDLKSLLHKRIERINDKELLQSVKDILEKNNESSKNITLKSYQEKRLEQAKKSKDQGNVLTNDQADQLVAEWLNQ